LPIPLPAKGLPRIYVPFVDETEAGKSAIPRSGESEKTLVFLEWKEASENTELCPVNAEAHQSAGGRDSIPRKVRMPARSVAAPGSAAPAIAYVYPHSLGR